jgi:hypothetical protein
MSGIHPTKFINLIRMVGKIFLVKQQFLAVKPFRQTRNLANRKAAEIHSTAFHQKSLAP